MSQTAKVLLRKKVMFSEMSNCKLINLSNDAKS